MSEYRADRCQQCHQSLKEIDNFGQRLRGCFTCNLWAAPEGGAWIRLSEENLRSFYKLRHDREPE